MPAVPRLARALRDVLGRPRSPIVQAGVGLALVVAAAAVRLPLSAALGDELAYLTFYPAVAIAAWAAGLWGGLAAVAGSAVLAVILFLLASGQASTAALVGLLIFCLAGVLIAVLCGQLHASRAQAVSARERSAFLADASAALQAGSNPMGMVDALVRATVPRFADVCAIDLFDPRGEFMGGRVASADGVAHADAPSAVAALVFQTGLPEIALDVPASTAPAEPGGPGAQGRLVLPGLRLRSHVTVPLAAPEGRRLGVLTVATAESRRQLSPDDVAVLIELGRRAGISLDHAALFMEVARRRDELTAVIEAIDDPVLVAELDGQVRSQNVAARRVLGDSLGARLDDVLAALPQVDGRPGVRRAGESGRFVMPIVFDTRAGTANARIAVLRDTTNLLENEAARDAFVGMLSHELRTPITTIFGTAQILQRPLDEAVRAELLADLAGETDRLLRLVEDLLVLSRFEQGRLEIAAEPVLIQRLVNTALARAAASHPGLRVEVATPEDLAPAQADATYVEQVLRNLISNAVKYAGETGRIQVRAEMGSDGLIHLMFEDDGPGIPEHDVERVFALYERLGDRAFKPGAGIGLFVCRRLVEAMGGRMWVRRGAMGGACFELTLPPVREPAVGLAGTDRRGRAGVATGAERI
jgi:signal transduction histidine kinase